MPMIERYTYAIERSVLYILYIQYTFYGVDLYPSLLCAHEEKVRADKLQAVLLPKRHSIPRAALLERRTVLYFAFGNGKPS